MIDTLIRQKVMVKLIFFIILYFASSSSFSQDNLVYYNLRNDFNKGYYSQIFSNEFGGPATNTAATKLSLVKTGFPQDLKQPEKEPTINELDYLGMAPIHYFAATRILSGEEYLNMKEIGKQLITLGANINLANQFGIKPIKLAFAYGNYAAVSVFLETGKLQKDIPLLRSLFSDELDDEWQIARSAIIQGKVEIWKMVRDAWLPDKTLSRIYLLNLRMSTIERFLNCNPEGDSFAVFNTRIINENFRAANLTLNLIIDSIERKRNASKAEKKLVKIPGTRFSVEVSEGKTIPAQELIKRGQ